MRDYRARGVIDAIQKSGPRTVFIDHRGRVKTIPAGLIEVGTYDSASTVDEIESDLVYAEDDPALRDARWMTRTGRNNTSAK